MIPALLLWPLLLLGVWVLPPRRRVLALAVGSVVNIALCAGIAPEVLRSGAVEWGPAGVRFAADGLSLLFLLASAVTGAGVALYASGYRSAGEGDATRPVAREFWVLWVVLLIGLNGIFLSANLLAILVFLELLGGAAVGMVALGGDRRAVAFARRYYFVRLPASVGFLFGLALLYSVYGTLNVGELAGRLEPSLLVSVAAALLMAGVLVKAALFPLHFWLPPAHSRAAGPASAALSALVVKGPFFVALRLWFDLLPEVATVGAAQLIGSLGAAGIIWGAAQALRARRLKLIIAHSTVSQMGYLFLLFPLLTGAAATAWETAAWTGGIYQAIAHAMAKAALLMSAGVVAYSIGSDRLRDMHGIAGRLPVTTFTIALSCVTLIGLPPSGGFIGKWLLLSAAIESGQWWWVPVLVTGALLTASYAFLMLSYAFQPEATEPSAVRRAPGLMEYTAMALALGAIVIGVRVQEPMHLLNPGTAENVREEEG